MLSESLVHPSPLSKHCTHPEWSKVLAKFLWTPHIQHTASRNYYRLVDATELWAPERPDKETVFFPKQSISWTLDIKHGPHNTIIQIFIHQTHLFFSFQICTSDLTHNCLYCILCFCHFVHCLIVYLYILWMSFCCTVELLSLYV